jgi:hypothetical protein
MQSFNESPFADKQVFRGDELVGPHQTLGSHPRHRLSDFAQSSETLGGYVGQAVLESAALSGVASILRTGVKSLCPVGTL